MKIKKGDQVLIISGKDRFKKGKVLRALPKEERLVVEGVNLRKKHLRPRKEGEKGQIVEIPAPLHISNVKLICPKCGKATRVGYKVISNIKKPSVHTEQRSKMRICKKCGQET